MAPLIIAAMAVAVAATIEAERRGAAWGGITKMIAASGYMVMAWQQDALATEVGGTIAVALMLSWLGDLLLVPKDKRAFIAGLASFLLAHVAFALAFWLAGATPWIVVAVVGLFAIASYPTMRGWLMPRVSRRMQGPVTAYIVAILIMLGTAFGAAHATGWWVLALAAVMFAASDLFVARHRFIVRHWHNRAIGLPLYFAAQVMFAYAAGSV